MSKIFKALSDPTRRQVLEHLRNGPKTAGELCALFPVSKPTMSAHFASLKEADLVVTERKGKQIVYRLKVSVLEDALLSFSQAIGLGLSRGKTAAGKRAARGQA